VRRRSALLLLVALQACVVHYGTSTEDRDPTPTVEAGVDGGARDVAATDAWVEASAVDVSPVPDGPVTFCSTVTASACFDFDGLGSVGKDWAKVQQSGGTVALDALVWQSPNAAAKAELERNPARDTAAFALLLRRLQAKPKSSIDMALRIEAPEASSLTVMWLSFSNALGVALDAQCAGDSCTLTLVTVGAEGSTNASLGVLPAKAFHACRVDIQEPSGGNIDVVVTTPGASATTTLKYNENDLDWFVQLGVQAGVGESRGQKVHLDNVVFR
jgi:hypothetical protein